MVYSYPHVLSHHRNNEGHSWLRSFWEVVKSGGDSDQIRVSRRRSSLRHQQRVLDQVNQRRTLLGNYIHQEQQSNKSRKSESQKNESQGSCQNHSTIETNVNRGVLFQMEDSGIPRPLISGDFSNYLSKSEEVEEVVIVQSEGESVPMNLEGQFEANETATLDLEAGFVRNKSKTEMEEGVVENGSIKGAFPQYGEHDEEQ